jgi:hypothetical protein
MSHYLYDKMLVFDSHEANKIALGVTHIDVSSAKSHKGDTIYSRPQKKTA